MCNHPYFADKISREEFRRRGIRPLDCEIYASQISIMSTLVFATPNS